MSLVEFVSARLRELRARHNLTQEQMAHLLDTDVKWYQRVEWSDKDLRASSIDRLAAVFSLTATQFLAADLPDTGMRRTVSSAPHKPRKAARKPKSS